jgi:hypothetical protein
VLDQRCKNIGDGQYPNDVGYTGGTKCVGVSASIEIFVVVPDCIKNLQGNTVIPPQHFIPGGGMSFDQRTFPGIEAPNLIKDRERKIGVAMS